MKSVRHLNVDLTCPSGWARAFILHQNCPDEVLKYPPASFSLVDTVHFFATNCDSKPQASARRSTLWRSWCLGKPRGAPRCAYSSHDYQSTLPNAANEANVQPDSDAPKRSYRVFHCFLVRAESHEQVATETRHKIASRSIVAQGLPLLAAALTAGEKKLDR